MSHAVLGVIAIVAIQRAINKILIGVFLTREYKHDETNRAWWTGKWYGRGMGTSAMSQPAREFIVKIVEMSLWTSDFLLAHLLLVILIVPCLIPYFDRMHATMLCKFLTQNLWLLVTYHVSLSLAPPIQADSCSPILDQAEAPAQMDCAFSDHLLTEQALML